MDTKVDVEVHSNLNNVLTSKSNTSKILDILLLGNKEAIRGIKNLNLKEVASFLVNMEQFGIS